MGNSINKEQKNYWNSHWTGLTNTMLNKNIFYVIDLIKLQYLIKKLPKKGKVLEVGGGSSRLSCFLAKKGYDTTILDYSEEALKVAKNNYKIMKVKGKFVYGNALDLPFKDGKYDVVLSTGLLEHFEEPSLVINEMVRVLKKNGLFFSDVIPKKFSLFRSLDFLPRLYLKIIGGKTDDMYERKISKKEMIHMLKKSGLKKVDVYSISVFPPKATLPSQLPLLKKSITVKKTEFKVFKKCMKLSKALDRTFISDILGFGYNCFGTKK